MKKLGAYINNDTYGVGTIIEQNTFVWYEVVSSLTQKIGEILYEVSIWSLKDGYPDGRKPDAKFKTVTKQLIEHTVIPIKEVADNYCIEWKECTFQIKQCMTRYDYGHDYENIMSLNLDNIGPNVCHWSWEGELAMSTLKDATVKLKNKIRVNDLAMPVKIDTMLNDELKKSLEKSILNSYYGVGGFTTNTEPFRVVKMAEKETETMEKKMTVTDSFLKNLEGITITSTYSKLHHGFGDPYYIYYPETEITEEMADTLLAVLLTAKRDFIHKVIFNPEKGTTTISKECGDPVTVKCKDAKFDYILGYNMARSKMYLGSDDYNWFNKIKNHRKTHIEYTEKKPTEPKTKKTSKKGGKK